MLSMCLILLLISLSIQGTTALKDFSDLDISNYTSCEKFLEKTTFDYKTLLDIDWKIFYFWSPDHEESYIMKFNVPSDVLIDRFRVELDNELKPPVNWTNAVLFMESTIDFSALIIKTKVPGMFQVIPTFIFEYSQIPIVTFGFKLVEPGYLGILNCKYRVCYALAPINKMPNHDSLENEAKKLGFWSDFGRTHTATIPPFPTLSPEHFDMDDDNEDENIEIQHQHHNLQFL